MKMKNNPVLLNLKNRLDKALRGIYLIVHSFPNRKARRNKAPFSKETTNKSLVNPKKRIRKLKINNEKETIQG